MFDLNPHPPNDQNPPLERSNQRFYRWSDPNYRRFNGSGGGEGGGVQFRLETMEEDSGVCSPPLWRSTSPPDSPGFRNGRYRSPSSRAQAIARGQMELMEMVKNMPESTYELSLKDIVEQRGEIATADPPADVSCDESQSLEGEERSILGNGYGESERWKKKKGSVKRQESNRKGNIMIRNGSFDQNRGLLINMVFPIPFGIRNKRKSFSSSINGSNHGAKVSPKPELLDKSSKYGGDQRDWWRKRFSGSSDSDNGGLTGSSSSSGGSTTGRSGSSGSSGSSAGGSVRSNSSRKSRGCSLGCWPSFFSKKKENFD